jgi:SOS-response transcriptional repressor LexA
MQEQCTEPAVYKAGNWPQVPAPMNRIKELREKRGLTLAGLADLADTSHATIQRLESGKMRLTQEWAERLAGPLNVHMVEVFGDVIPAVVDGLPVLGSVQAGVWREADVADEPKYGPLPISPDTRYAGKPQFALRVVGNSMNRVVQDGSYIVCVSWAELGRQPRDGDLVVVERRRDGLIETTIKRIQIANRKILLMPDSDDPRWQSPIELEGGLENDEIAIAALVVGKYQQLD